MGTQYDQAGLTAQAQHILANIMAAQQGKTGAELVECATRHAYGQPTIKGEQLLMHGDFSQNPVQCLATLNQLTYGEKRLGEQHVQEYLWQGYKQNDRNVPLSTAALSATATKLQQWKAEAEADPYATTSRAAAMGSALPAAELGAATQSVSSILNETDSHAGSSGGRHPKSKTFSKELDKSYQKIGLRGNYY